MWNDAGSFTGVSFYPSGRRLFLLVFFGWRFGLRLVFLLGFLRILTSVFTGSLRLRGLGRARVLPGVVSNVPAASLELNRGGRKQLFDCAVAIRALLDRLIRELQDFFEAVTAFLALVFVKWHVHKF